MNSACNAAIEVCPGAVRLVLSDEDGPVMAWVMTPAEVKQLVSGLNRAVFRAERVVP